MSCARSGAPPKPAANCLMGWQKKVCREQLAEMQRVIGAEKSDLFDVLSYIAFAAEPKTRAERAEFARAAVARDFGEKQAFINFVLDQYETQGRRT